MILSTNDRMVVIYNLVCHELSFYSLLNLCFLFQNISALAKVTVKGNNVTGHVDTVKYVGFTLT